ncbi:MAG: hypothetical protein R2729_27125 [Bryobacteraceae bacterium]
MGSSAGAVLQLVHSARRRALVNLIAEQITVGLIATLGGAILLLLLGTQILDWHWLLVLFLGGAALSAYRTWRYFPSPYQVAQTVDRRLSLHDAISTAFHFASPGVSPRLGEAAIVDMQREDANSIAGTLQPALAMPWSAPKSAAPMLALAAAVAGLGVLRYGLHGSLDLEKPIVEPMAALFQPGPEKTARYDKRGNKRSSDDPLAIPIDNPDAPTQELDAATEAALSQVDVPDTTQGEDPSASARTKQTEVKAAGDEVDESTEAGDEGDRESGEGKEGAADSSKDGGEGGGEKGDPSKEAPRKGAGGDNESLMNKMKDAMANLMSKLKIPQQAGQQRQAGASQKDGGQKDANGKQSGAGQKGEKGQGQPQGQGSPSDDPNAEGQQGEQQQAQSGQGRNNDKGSDAGTPNESQSGMGKQDGAKDIQNAEQVAAMGKLSEIFGKRAQNITGEVMVEVQSSKQQQLRTQYSQREGTHREAGGEIHRDQVPEALQHYVQQYFEQVRRGERMKSETAAPAEPAK